MVTGGTRFHAVAGGLDAEHCHAGRVSSGNGVDRVRGHRCQDLVEEPLAGRSLRFAVRKISSIMGANCVKNSMNPAEGFGFICEEIVEFAAVIAGAREEVVRSSRIERHGGHLRSRGARPDESAGSGWRVAGVARGCH